MTISMQMFMSNCINLLSFYSESRYEPVDTEMIIDNIEMVKKQILGNLTHQSIKKPNKTNGLSIIFCLGKVLC